MPYTTAIPVGRFLCCALLSQGMGDRCGAVPNRNRAPRAAQEAARTEPRRIAWPLLPAPDRNASPAKGPCSRACVGVMPPRGQDGPTVGRGLAAGSRYWVAMTAPKTSIATEAARPTSASVDRCASWLACMLRLLVCGLCQARYVCIVGVLFGLLVGGVRLFLSLFFLRSLFFFPFVFSSVARPVSTRNSFGT